MKSTKAIAIGIILIVFAASLSIIYRSVRPTSSILLSPDLGNATYSFYGDTFSMNNGQAILQQGHAFSRADQSGQSAQAPLIPVGYTLGATGTGTMTPNGSPYTVAAVYREFGANLQWTVLFLFTQNPDGSLRQIASGVAYEEDAKIESVSFANGTITLNLLVVSQADQQKPHYEQTPSEPDILHFKISGDQLIPL
jgi:hypothetical protein